MQRFICVPTAADARKSSYLFGVLYLASPFLWFLPPMMFRSQEPNADPEQAYILACQSVLPAGMIGLMVAAMFSATASMISAQLNVFAGVLTCDIYAPLARRGASDSHLVMVGRAFTLLLGGLMMGAALAIPYLGGAEYVIIAAASLVVAPLLGPTIWGLFSERVGAAAVWVTAAVSVLVATMVKTNVFEIGLDSASTDMDIIVGVILPIVVLICVQLASRGPSPGWQRVSELARKQVEVVAPEPSRMPALVVAGSLVACGLMMSVLAVFDAGSRFILGAFAATLLLLATIILAAAHRGATRAEKVGHHVDA